MLEPFLPEGPQLFPDGMVTDQPERQVCAELIREKLLLCLDKEIPHGTAVELTKFSERTGSGILDIDATIYCEKESHKGILIGRGGGYAEKNLHPGPEGHRGLYGNQGLPSGLCQGQEKLEGQPQFYPGRRACLKHVNMPNRRVFCPLDGAIFPCNPPGFLRKNCLPAAQNPSLPDTSPIFKQALGLV